MRKLLKKNTWEKGKGAGKENVTDGVIKKAATRSLSVNNPQIYLLLD